MNTARSARTGPAGRGGADSAERRDRAVGCSGSSRDLPNLPSRTISSSLAGSKSPRSRRDRLADPHPGDRQQADQRPDRRGAMRRWDQRLGGVHQREDLVVGVEVRRRATRPRRQQIGWRHLVRGVERVQVRGEAADDRQPVALPVRGCRCAGEVAQASACSVVIRSLLALVQLVDELRQQLLVALELVAERAADAPDSQRGAAQASSCAPPGQGRAIAAARRGRPWRRSRSSAARGDAAPARSPAATRPRAASRSRRCGAAGARGSARRPARWPHARRSELTARRRQTAGAAPSTRTNTLRSCARRGTAAPQVGDDRLADIDRQRQPLRARAPLPRTTISPARQSTSSRESRATSPARSPSRSEQRQDREVTAARSPCADHSSTAAARPAKAAHRFGKPASRQPATDGTA